MILLVWNSRLAVLFFTFPCGGEVEGFNLGGGQAVISAMTIFVFQEYSVDSIIKSCLAWGNRSVKV